MRSVELANAAGEGLKWLASIAPLGTAVAAVFGAFTAWKGLQKWRDETLRKRRAEVAEQVLAGFYRVQDTFRWVRSPAVWSWEKQPTEGESDNPTKDHNYAPIRRLLDEREFFSEFRASQYAYAALFDREAAKPFSEVVTIHNQIFAAAEDLLDYNRCIKPHEPGYEHLYEHLREIKRIAFSEKPMGKADPIEERIEALVTTIESTCRPAIEAREAARSR